MNKTVAKKILILIFLCFSASACDDINKIMGNSTKDEKSSKNSAQDGGKGNDKGNDKKDKKDKTDKKDKKDKTDKKDKKDKTDKKDKKDKKDKTDKKDKKGKNLTLTTEKHLTLQDIANANQTLSEKGYNLEISETFSDTKADLFQLLTEEGVHPDDANEALSHIH